MKVCKVETLSVSHRPSTRIAAFEYLDREAEKFIQETLKKHTSWEVTSINDNFFPDDGSGYPLITRRITFGEKE